jgi:hypothetical protein
MPVVAAKTELRCKLCRHERRAEIDELLLRRSRREQDDEGRNINLGYVLGRLGEWGVENPTEENVKVHFRRHCEVISENELAEQAKLEAELDAEIGEEARRLAEEYEGRDDADSYLELVRRIGQLRLLAELRRGGVPSVTVDQARAVVDAQTRRKHNERVNTLLELQGLAMGLDIQEQLTAGEPTPTYELEASDDDVEEVHE